MAEQFATATMPPRWQQRWWMRSRQVKSTHTPQGWTASSELYVPWWAKPLDLLHGIVFGNPKIEIESAA